MADTLATILLGLFALASEPQPHALERLQAGEPLRVVTRDNAVTFFQGPRGPVGFEVSLLEGFAELLGTRIEYSLAEGPGPVVETVAAGEADLAAAALSVTEQRRSRVRTGPGYQTITQQVVYLEQQEPPQSLQDLNDCGVLVAAGSSHVETLERLRWSHPFLSWREIPETDTDEVIERIAEAGAGCTIADSNELTLARRFHPQLRAAFDVGEPRELAWMLPQRTDNHLYLAVARYFAELRAEERLSAIIDQHFGQAEEFDYVSARRLHRHAERRLPPLLPWFKRAGEEFGIDWRLLAAIGYQESHWSADAVSPTGVRGIMMLTEDTAGALGVEDRVDPRESIFGGARYLRRMQRKIPERIGEPDRTWFALAAYNIGYGHLEDARVLTQKNGGDPDSWEDVREHLPLLADPEWHPQTRHGFARGGQPVHYVDNVRHYYDILLWLNDRDAGRQLARTEAAREVSGETTR